MYYALIVVSVVMFGGGFALNDGYRKLNGSSMKVSLRFSLVGSLAGFLFLALINGFQLEFTPFTLVMALITALNGFGFTLCSFKALDRINLSLYSLFSMLGGMVLPFAQGILFYGEAVTVAKVLCFLCITVALALTVQKGEQKKGTVYYICIFVLNGMSGVLSKLFAEATYPKTSATGYTMWISICTVVIAAALLLTVFRKRKDGECAPGRKLLIAGTAIGAAAGITNRLANLLLVLALAHVDASVQYPMVTGGVMIVSTLICFFGERKPSKRELLSVLLAFVGMLALFLIK